MNFDDKLNKGVLYITAAGIVVSAPEYVAKNFHKFEVYTSEKVGIPLKPAKPQGPMGPNNTESTPAPGFPIIPTALTSAASGVTGMPTLPPPQDGFAPIQPIALRIVQNQVNAYGTHNPQVYHQVRMSAALLAELSKGTPPDQPSLS